MVASHLGTYIRYPATVLQRDTMSTSKFWQKTHRFRILVILIIFTDFCIIFVAQMTSIWAPYNTWAQTWDFVKVLQYLCLPTRFPKGRKGHFSISVALRTPIGRPSASMVLEWIQLDLQHIMVAKCVREYHMGTLWVPFRMYLYHVPLSSFNPSWIPSAMPLWASI